MTLPRPVLIAILALALCAAAFLATRSANDTGSAVTSVTPQPTPVVKHHAKPVKPVHGAKSHKIAPAQQSPAGEATAPRASRCTAGHVDQALQAGGLARRRQDPPGDQGTRER